MAKNPDYWGPEPTLDEIYFDYYTNADTMAQDLKSGLIDGANDIPPAQFDQFETTAGFDTIAYNLFMWEYLNFNCADKKRLPGLDRRSGAPEHGLPQRAQLGRRQAEVRRRRLGGAGRPSGRR